LAAKGYRVLYLNEKLSAGLAAENISVQALQRTRWAQGTLQAFFIKTNPLTIPGLNLLQRLAHLEGLLHWFTSPARVGLLFIPLAYAFLHIIPVRATGAEVLFFFVPFYLVQITAFSWLNSRSRSAVLSDVYSLVLAFPLAVTVIKVMLNMNEMRMLPAQVELMEEELVLPGQIASVDLSDEFPVMQVLFESLNLNQQRGLVELLYCRPGQWKSRCSPGEFESLGLLFKILLRPRFLFERKAHIRAIAVAQR
jgi:membrane glycosyltransferase